VTDRQTVMFRQGDVLLVRVPEVPTGKAVQPENGRLILARGEATGHHHSVAVLDENAELIEAAEGVFLRIMAASTLEHQEHAAIALAPGTYKVTRQVEYEPGELPRQVAD
jgi:hypothetical protein